MVETGDPALQARTVMDASRCGRQRSTEIEGRESRRMMTIMMRSEVPVVCIESGIGGAGHMVEVT